MKTRLARAIGAETAAALYARLAHHIVERCSWPARYRTAICYDPPGAGRAVRAWLGGLEVAEFLAQRGRGLGARLRAGFDTFFRRGAQRVVLIGSDCPGVDRGVVTEALGALRRHQVVLGPSEDGGYYLIGLTAPAPGLLRGIAWSTGQVFRQTHRNARAAGLRVATLAPRRDIDTVEDARSLNWLPARPSRSPLTPL